MSGLVGNISLLQNISMQNSDASGGGEGPHLYGGVLSRCVESDLKVARKELNTADKFRASVFDRTKDGSTLMHIAALNGHPETAMVRLAGQFPHDLTPLCPADFVQERRSSADAQQERRPGDPHGGLQGPRGRGELSHSEGRECGRGHECKY